MEDLDRRLDAIRKRTRPAVLKRINVIEAAAADSGQADLPEARSQAHMLRGLLGTIGLARGSELAATIEDELERAVAGNPEAGWELRVTDLAASLRLEIEAD